MADPEPIDLNFVTTDVAGGSVLQWANTFTDVTDLVNQVIAQLKPGQCLRRLVIAGHGAEHTAGFFVFDPDTSGVETIDGSSKLTAAGQNVEEQLQRLKKYFCPDGCIEFRVCRFGEGDAGGKVCQMVADWVGVPVTGPMGSISSLALIGGLATSWRTVYPQSFGLSGQTSFWRGSGTWGRGVASPQDVAPVTAQVVPMPDLPPPPQNPPAGTGPPTILVGPGTASPTSPASAGSPPDWQTGFPHAPDPEAPDPELGGHLYVGAGADTPSSIVDANPTDSGDSAFSDQFADPPAGSGGPLELNPESVPAPDGADSDVTFAVPAASTEVTVTVQDGGLTGNGSSTVGVANPVAPPAPAEPAPPPDEPPMPDFNLGASLPAPAPGPEAAASTMTASEANSWLSWFGDLYDRMGGLGCLLGAVLVVALVVLGVFELQSHLFGAPTASTSANVIRGTSGALVIGAPITGDVTYTGRIGSQTFTRGEVITYQAPVLSVDTQPTTGTTGGSCIDYRNAVSSTGVSRTQEVFRLCKGGGTPITTTCDPAFPLFMTTLVKNVPQTFSSTCVTPSATPTSTSQAFTDSGSIMLADTVRSGGATYAVIHRMYSRRYSSSAATTIGFDETSVYRLDRWEEIGTTTTSTLASTTSSSQFALQGAPAGILALLPAPAPASNGTSGGGSSSNGSSNGGASVTIAFNQLSFTGLQASSPTSSICSEGGILHLGVTIDGIANGTPVAVQVTGPNLDQSVNFAAGPGQEYQATFKIQRGGGTFTDTIVSIGGKAPPASGSHVMGTWQC